LLSPSSLWLGDNLRNQALLRLAQQRYADAIRNADAAQAIYEESFGKHYDHFPTVLIVKGLSLARTGRSHEGEVVLREAVAMRLLTLDASHFWVAESKGALGECLAIAGKRSEAEDLLRSSYESLSRSQQPDSPRLAAAGRRLSAISNAS
jgi:tetratricopeptide (TPR) repeat protein